VDFRAVLVGEVLEPIHANYVLLLRLEHHNQSQLVLRVLEAAVEETE